MKMVRAIIRPEKQGIVLSEMLSGGFSGVTQLDVYGRGKQKGIKVGDVQYDEIPKSMLLFMVEDADVEDVVKIITRNAKSGKDGTYGDGRIFITPVEEAITISTGKKGL